MERKYRIIKLFILWTLIFGFVQCAPSKHPYKKKNKRKGEPCDCPDMKKNRRKRTGYMYYENSQIHLQYNSEIILYKIEIM